MSTCKGTDDVPAKGPEGLYVDVGTVLICFMWVERCSQQKPAADPCNSLPSNQDGQLLPFTKVAWSSHASD